MNPYLLFRNLLFRPVIRLLWRPWLEGAENVPERGPVILVSNHVSWGDTLITPVMLPRQMTFPAKAEIFDARGKGIGHKVVAWFLPLVGIRPMDRSGGRASVDALAVVNQDLSRGERVLGIYPEGTRSPDGRLYKGKTGVARLVLSGEAVVLPVGLVGSQMYRGRLGIPMMRRPGVRIGRPLRFDEQRSPHPDRQTLRWVTDEIMAAIQDLTGQEYVDVYAASVKSGQVGAEELRRRVLPRPGAPSRPPTHAAQTDPDPRPDHSV